VINGTMASCISGQGQHQVAVRWVMAVSVRGSLSLVTVPAPSRSAWSSPHERNIKRRSWCGVVIVRARVRA